MKSIEIKKLIDSQEPIAIIRYFEWAIFSKDYANAKYLLLRMNRRRNKIKAVNVPDDITSFIISRLDDFEKVCSQDGCTVWERMAFREKVKAFVPESKVARLINK
ncbi:MULTISPECIES: hypothetical protein [Sinomicrobium]|uniref:Uncharacterized protein n=1 Tax=Sinomicrobium weinanense TaxID=2842200 RepID=A0A926JQ47_9FLAO|nr:MULTISPECIES: hypothetical protein [Sinomicrobium]MBC9795422.1 hypothetical protein [Sinomicrobium weinanense]MBU3123947.1 hypothetical protein [Sinomicrobium weinanense]UGU14442.1 hypothetical protein LS482_12095 [Sinomicrobium kalidii]